MTKVVYSAVFLSVVLMCSYAQSFVNDVDEAALVSLEAFDKYTQMVKERQGIDYFVNIINPEVEHTAHQKKLAVYARENLPENNKVRDSSKLLFFNTKKRISNGSYELKKIIHHTVSNDALSCSKEYFLIRAAFPKNEVVEKLKQKGIEFTKPLANKYEVLEESVVVDPESTGEQRVQYAGALWLGTRYMCFEQN